MANMKLHSGRRITQDTPVQKKRKLRITCGVILALLLCFAVGNVYGRYVQGANNTGTLTAKAFYFTSDLLPASDETPKIYVLNAGTDSLSFKLYNYQDTLNVSATDVYYTVSVSENGGGDSTLTSGTISAGSAKSADVVLTDLEDGKTYLVTVTGESKAGGGYLQTLKATFKVAEGEQKVYKHLDTTSDSHYVLLTVWTDDVAGTLTIEKIPEDLIPDQTDPRLLGVVGGKTGYTDATSFVAKNSSHVYRFFRETENQPFTLSDFGEADSGGNRNPSNDICLTDSSSHNHYAEVGTP